MIIKKAPFSQKGLASTPWRWQKSGCIRLWRHKYLKPLPWSSPQLTRDHFPQSRVVLAKSVENEGVVFFTNYQSHKGEQIEGSPKVSINFFWAELQRQIRVTGVAEKMSTEASEAYFASRPRLSQLSALVSDQSKQIASRETLEKKFKSLENTYHGQTIPKPGHWGGYLVAPLKVEFWQGRENRLHDRFLYEKEGDGWKISRLSP